MSNPVSVRPTQPPLQAMVLTALITGLMCASAFISIPFPEVPMILANAFPWLAGLLLGPLWGAVSAALYLAIGAVGAPVFAGGKSGLGVLLGSTGGFLFGFVLSAVVAGLLRDPSGKSLFRTILATVAGLLSVYLAGIPWLSFVVFKGDGLTAEHLIQAALWGTGSKTFPGLFLVGDALKAIGVVLVAQVLAQIPATRGLFVSKASSK